jgi:hypothetical protein
VSSENGRVSVEREIEWERRIGRSERGAAKKEEARAVLKVVHGRDIEVRDGVILPFAYIFHSVSSFIFVVYPSEHPNGMFRWVHNKSKLCNDENMSRFITRDVGQSICLSLGGDGGGG